MREYVALTTAEGEPTNVVMLWPAEAPSPTETPAEVLTDALDSDPATITAEDIDALYVRLDEAVARALGTAPAPGDIIEFDRDTKGGEPS